MKKLQKYHRNRPNQKIKVRRNKYKRNCDLQYQSDLRFSNHLRKIGITAETFRKFLEMGIVVTSKKHFNQLMRTEQ